MVSDLNLWQRINKIREQITYIQKDTKVAFGNTKYMAVTHDAVTTATRQALIDHGVGVKVDIAKHELSAKRFVGEYEISLINIDKPDDREVFRAVSLHDSGGDKSPGSAESYALKRVLLKVFSIPTGTDDEAVHEEKVSPSEKISSAKLYEISSEARSLGIDVDLMLSRTAKVMGYESMDLVPLDKIEDAKAWIQKAVDAKMARGKQNG